MVTRGQAYTLEGVLGAILVVTATVYGLQAIDTRAWEDETQTDTQQLEYRASDVLTLAGTLHSDSAALTNESSALRDAVLCYRPGRPINGGRDRTLAEFEQMLNTTFDSQATQYQLRFSYSNGSSRISEVVSEESGDGDNRPSATAAVASTTVTVSDNMSRRRGPGCNPIPVTVAEDDSLYMPDAAPDSPLYNVVEVRLTVW
jgi:hypothetical protein